MTYLLSGLVALVVFHALERRQFTDALKHAYAAPSADTAALIGLVADLCQRVQAPEQAVVEHAMKTVEPPPMPEVAFTDEQHWLANGMTKEQLAEMADRIELAG